MDDEQYYKQLEGFTIDKFLGFADSALRFPAFQLRSDDYLIRIEVSRDPEGNGGGFLFISEADCEE